jgi:hypothetical protein
MNYELRAFFASPNLMRIHAPGVGWVAFLFILQFHIKQIELQLRGSSDPINRVRTVPILICHSQ